jgi:hypothetical protein
MGFRSTSRPHTVPLRPPGPASFRAGSVAASGLGAGAPLSLIPGIAGGAGGAEVLGSGSEPASSDALAAASGVTAEGSSGTPGSLPAAPPLNGFCCDSAPGLTSDGALQAPPASRASSVVVPSPMRRIPCGRLRRLRRWFRWLERDDAAVADGLVI